MSVWPSFTEEVFILNTGLYLGTFIKDWRTVDTYGEGRRKGNKNIMTLRHIFALVPEKRNNLAKKLSKSSCDLTLIREDQEKNMCLGVKETSS